MNCEKTSKISEYVDGTLDKVEAVELEFHIDTCAECSEFLNDIIAIKAEINAPAKSIASSLRRVVIKDIKSMRKQKFIRIASAAAAVILIIAAIPFFINNKTHTSGTEKNSIDDTASNYSISGAATPQAALDSIDAANNNEIDLFFSSDANKGQEKSIYGFECTYNNTQAPAPQAAMAAQSNNAKTSAAADETVPNTSPLPIKYTIYVSGFQSSQQQVELRKGLIGLSAPASKDTFITDDGNIPINTLEALKLMDAQKLKINIIFDPSSNSITANNIKLVFN